MLKGANRIRIDSSPKAPISRGKILISKINRGMLLHQHTGESHLKRANPPSPMLKGASKIQIGSSLKAPINKDLPSKREGFIP
jgi:hypothetical protein